MSFVNQFIFLEMTDKRHDYNVLKFRYITQLNYIYLKSIMSFFINLYFKI